jgi:hypothetical protein
MCLGVYFSMQLGNCCVPGIAVKGEAHLSEWWLGPPLLYAP